MEKTDKFHVKLEEPMLVSPHPLPPERTLYLSPLDLQAPLFMYTLYFYKGDKISACKRGFDILKEALQKVLALYYPAAGRLKVNLESGQSEIECNNEGAMLVKATTDARIEELGDPMNSTDPELEKFVYKLRPKSENPILSVQVTTCACGGIIIGFGSRHELLDAFSALQFLSAWAALARGASFSDIPVPSHERELLKPKPSELSTLQQSSLIMKKFDGIPLITQTNEKQSWEGTVTDFASHGTRPQYIMRVFKLTKQSLDHLKATAMESGDVERCSTFDVITAHAWQARVRALEMDPSERIMLRFTVDGRRAIVPPLPSCFIGNVFVMASHACTVRDIADSPLSSIVKRVQKAKADMTDSYIRRMISSLAAAQKSMKALPSFRETTIVTDWTRFPHHLLDFGWGGTIFATQVAMPLLDVIFLTSIGSRNDDLFVRLGLLPDYMEKFEQHFMQIQAVANKQNDSTALAMW